MKLNNDGSNYDDFVAELPPEVLSIFRQMETDAIDGFNYEQLAEYSQRLEKYGLTFDYYLDAEPFDFEYKPLKIEI